MPLVNDLTRNELKAIRRSVLCAYKRMYDRYMYHRGRYQQSISPNKRAWLNSAFDYSGPEHLRLIRWYATGITQLTNMLQFADKAIAVAKERKGK